MPFLKNIVAKFFRAERRPLPKNSRKKPKINKADAKPMSFNRSENKIRDLRKIDTKKDFDDQVVGSQIEEKIRAGRTILVDRIAFLRNAIKFNENDLRRINDIKGEQDYAEYALHNILPQVLKLRESGFLDEKTVAHIEILYNKYLKILAKPKNLSSGATEEKRVEEYKKALAEKERTIDYLTNVNEKFAEQITVMKKYKKENGEFKSEIISLQAKLAGLEVILHNLVQEEPDQQRILEINKQLLDENFRIKGQLKSKQKEVYDIYKDNEGAYEDSDNLIEKLKNNSKLYDRYFEADEAKNFVFQNGKSFDSDMDEMEVRLSEIGELNKLVDYRQSVLDQLRDPESMDFKDSLFHKLEKENEQLVNLIEASKSVVDSVVDDEVGGVKPLKLLLEFKRNISNQENEISALKSENDKLINKNSQLLRENQDTMAMYNKFKSKMSDYENSLRFFEKNEKEYFELKRELASEKQKSSAYKNQYDNLNRKYTKILNRYQELVHEYDTLFTQFGVRN